MNQLANRHILRLLRNVPTSFTRHHPSPVHHVAAAAVVTAIAASTSAISLSTASPTWSQDSHFAKIVSQPAQRGMI
ncbi:hypothetical protein [Laceyella putida]|uniref:Uncharacterized protein n=1 Tax=Laceyella putida TaxID=110101 RepID=A0ABW2RJB5_9BACL